MSTRKPNRPAKAQSRSFELAEPHLPIAGLPPPKPCPFCGDPDNSIVMDIDPDEQGSRFAHVECACCGAEAPCAVSDAEKFRDSYELAKEAARLWNERKGGAV
jgi:Lar family restriction alleviation protein